ncbi:MAG: allantoicase [Candidatus Marinimicrobia bacterium]|nr:allantoicase [Candidatus Neomarinimicrobiota bacterium]
MVYEGQINVTSSDFGSKVIYCSDEFFADSSRMLQNNEAVFIEDKYDEHGKWMDGWETRRRRDGKNDFCYIRLGSKSVITDFDIDTSNFTGNYAPAISILGCCVAGGVTDDRVVDGSAVNEWFDLLAKEKLTGDSSNVFSSKSLKPITHLKVTLYPDGGIARLRAYGNVCSENNTYEVKGINVIAKESGARAIFANDEHFGCLSNILEKHKPINMADGWETRRRREPGNDWGIVALAKPATVDEIVIDTKFFKGNYPDTFSICTTCIDETDEKTLIEQSNSWNQLIDRKKLEMNQIHVFEKSELLHQDPITHIRIDIFPDGGIARLKLIGNFINHE